MTDIQDVTADARVTTAGARKLAWLNYVGWMGQEGKRVVVDFTSETDDLPEGLVPERIFEPPWVPAAAIDPSGEVTWDAVAAYAPEGWGLEQVWRRRVTVDADEAVAAVFVPVSPDA